MPNVIIDRSDLQGIMQKMQIRKRQKAALLDRKSAASQSRMKNVASLATDIPGPRKRRKGNEGTYRFQLGVLPFLY